MSKPRPTDAEFAELARKRDEEVERVVAECCEKMGWDRKEITFHASHQHGCYCACPDGPCQHIWDGPNKPIGLEEGQDESEACGWSTTCSRCGADAMSHDMRCAP
jgi:hypothetical protein